MAAFWNAMGEIIDSGLSAKAYRMADAFGRRNDFAFFRSGEPKMGQFATTAGSASVRRPSVTLTPYESHVRKTSRAHDEAKRAALTLGTTIQTPKLLQHNYFGSLTAWEDNALGECRWHTLGLFPPDVMDNLGQTNDADQSLINTMFNLNHITSITKFRNMSTTQAEVDCWLLYPRRDIPIDEKVVTSPGYFLGEDPQFIQDAFSADNRPIITPAASGTVPIDDFKPAQLVYYDYWASPYQAPLITRNFKLKYGGQYVLNPGDQFELKHAMGNQLVAPRIQLNLPPSSEGKITDAWQSHYGYMRRSGPLLLLRCRGSICHLESKQAVEPVNTVGTGTNMSLFNVEFIQHRVFNYNNVSTTAPFYDGQQAMVEDNALSFNNQGVIADGKQFYQRIVEEASPEI